MAPNNNIEVSNTGGNSAGNESNERRIRDMLGLVKFCLQNTADEDGQATSNPTVMDPDRRAWLEEAISSMTVDTTKLLLENLATVKETVSNFRDGECSPSVTVQKTCNSLSILTDLCEEIDYAADFAKLDGFSIFRPIIGCCDEELIVKACELIAALAQNNPLCQKIAMDTRTLEMLTDFVDIKDSPTHIKARSYALYAISSIIRSNKEVRQYFKSKLEGLGVLLRLLDHDRPESINSAPVPPMSALGDAPDSTTSVGEHNISSALYWWRKLKIRSIFLFSTLCSESKETSQFFFEKDALLMADKHLKRPYDSEIREHLLNGLKAFLRSLDPPKRIKSLNLVPDLKQTVSGILDSCKIESDEHYDLTDTKTSCYELLKLIDDPYVVEEEQS